MDFDMIVLALLTKGDVDGAMKVIVDAREAALGITPKQAHLVRAGLAAGRLLEDAPPPRLRPTLTLIR